MEAKVKSAEALPVLDGFMPLEQFFVREGKPSKLKIAPANMQTAIFEIGTPADGCVLCQQKFTEEARLMMQQKMERGETEKSKRAKRPARDFAKEFEAAKHKSREGWEGFNAAAIRSAMISVCPLVGMKTGLAKLSIFVEADGWDMEEGTPLVRLYGDPAIMKVHAVQVTTGMGVPKPDLRARPFYENWRARLRIRFDADQFTVEDIANLLVRVGNQNGIGAGRPNSKRSNGQDWGRFEVKGVGGLIKQKAVA